MLTQYEENIKITQQNALDAADSESVLTGTSLGKQTIFRGVKFWIFFQSISFDALYNYAIICAAIASSLNPHSVS